MSERFEAKPRTTTGLDNSRWLFAALCVGAVFYTFGAAWLVTGGASDPVAHVAEYIEFLTTPWMIADLAVATALIAFGIWYLKTSPNRAADVKDIDAAMKRQTVRLAIAWLIVSASLVLIGFLYYADLKATSRTERAAQQESVARLKSQQITKWLLERTIDAEFLATALRGIPFDRLSTDRDVRRTIELLFAEVLAGHSERTSVTLFTPDGKILAHDGEAVAPAPATIQAVQTLATHPQQRQSIVDVHLDGTPPRPRMDFLVPLREQPGTGPVTAVLAMAIDPFETLLPQILVWPTPSPTSEAVVVRRDGDDAVYITPPSLLQPAAAPLAFRIPLAGSKIPAARAITEGDGLWIGPDYRGVEVLTAARRVIGVPWIVIAKTDLAEIAHPLLLKQFTLILVIGAASVLAGFLLIVLWRGEYASLLAFRDQQREDRLAVAEHFAHLTRQARDIVMLLAPDGLIVEANEAAIKAYGYEIDELMRLTHRDLRPPQEMTDVAAQWQAAAAPGGTLFETIHRRKDGSTFPVEVSGRELVVDGKSYRQAFIRDITRRKALERDVARLSRVQRALQAATSVLLRARSENELFQEMCEILVQLGDYRMACVAAPNNDAGKTVRYLTKAGNEDGYLALTAITWGDGPHSKGPTGTAIRTGEVQVNQDFTNNPAMALWREEALKRGYRSSMSLPLKVDGKVSAALILYAEQPNAFDKEEQALLFALAEDVSYAVFRMRTAGGSSAG